MRIVVGVDLGTTKITSVAYTPADGHVLAVETVTNDANITNPEDRVRGRSEWDATRIIASGLQSLKQLCAQLGPEARHIEALGITGQQHGMLLIDAAGSPLSPLINWQDRRALENNPATGQNWLENSRARLGADVWKRTGCVLQPGFLAGTLDWLRHQGRLPGGARAVMIMELFASELTGLPPVSEPSCAGSSGVFNVRCRNWDAEAIAALGLSQDLFVPIQEAATPLGPLSVEASRTTGLPPGLPVFPAVGDHQASFLGSVQDRSSSLLINVGTGAQVARYTDGFDFAPPIELRPFPCGGNLLSNVGLAGGWSYQVAEQFFRNVGRTLFAHQDGTSLYAAMNEMAATVPPGSDGLICDPVFAGTRLDSSRRGMITGLSPQNFTAAHLVRAILEGMARSLHEGAQAIEQITGTPAQRLVAAGNGLRENPLLAEIVSQAFGLPITWTNNREEAACGAARIAANA